MFDILTALGLADSQHSLIAITGGGGKSTLLFALGEALAAHKGRTVLTATTRLFANQVRRPDALQIDPARPDAARLPVIGQLLDRFGLCVVVGEAVGAGKVQGVPPALAMALSRREDVAFVVAEADGSRQMPVKAPGAHEPVIPAAADLVVVMMGLDGLERPLSEVAHRLPVLRHLLEIDGDQPLTPAQAAALLVHPQGGMKGVPVQARVVVWLNKAETAVRQSLACRIARDVLRQSRVTQVVIGALQSPNPVKLVAGRVTAVVLAAGSARRMGQTKQLLPWGQTTVLGQTLANVQASWVTDVAVVTGHEETAVAAEASRFGGRVWHNAAFASGEMISSLQVALQQLDGRETAVLVVLADQPMVKPETINALIQAFWQGKGGIIAPTYQGRRGNPVLISRRYFAELLTLPPGDAPRTVLRRHPEDVVLLSVADEGVVVDLDTLENYEAWRPKTDDE
ncbi:MAG: molybdenum cofactor cytidylyltransferase [Candidatus Promineifilaceae bacterium]